MTELIQKLFHDAFYKILFGAGSVIVVGTWAWYRARSAWRRREYLDRLNFSLNSFDGKTLKIRTLLEESLESIMLNRIAVSMVRKGAHKARVDDPVLHFAKKDAWFILNAVLNTLSERFASGILKQDILRNSKGETSTIIPTARYLFCLTCEKNAQVRTQKIRVMVIRKDLLESLPLQRPQLEREVHSTRWETLQKMAAAHRETPHDFLEVELSV